ncbi:MAG: hypothetical protein ACREQY_19790, partial [Candidatus Binatia bacterium]
PLREVPYTAGFIDRGFDVSLAAYDFDRLGWKFQCVTPEGEPLDVCPPTAVSGAVATARPAMPGAQVWLANQSPRPLTQAEVEARKIYDTTRYGRSNVGHSWTGALSEEEVGKILEYLKTL